MPAALLLTHALAALLLTSPPAGWLVHPGPDAEFTGTRQCANYSRQLWSVAVVEDELRITPTTPEGSQSRDPHEVSLPGGRLVGEDNGEWGGGLWWYPDGATSHKQLSKQNVRAILSLPNKSEALVFTGLAHLGFQYADVLLIQLAGGSPQVRKIASLTYPPSVIHLEPEGSYLLLLDDRLVRLHPDGQLDPVCLVGLSSLHARTLAVFPDGDIFVGMSQFVARLRPTAPGTCDIQWFVSESCPRFEVRKLDCVCISAATEPDNNQMQRTRPAQAPAPRR